MIIEEKLHALKSKYCHDIIVNVRLKGSSPLVIPALQNIELISRSELYGAGGILLYAKTNVSEKELYNKVTSILSENDTIPEAIEFLRLSLEQVYLGITSGRLATGL
jgi:hypothetical protein